MRATTQLSNRCSWPTVGSYHGTRVRPHRTVVTSTLKYTARARESACLRGWRILGFSGNLLPKRVGEREKVKNLLNFSRLYSANYILIGVCNVHKSTINVLHVLVCFVKSSIINVH